MLASTMYFPGENTLYHTSKALKSLAPALYRHVLCFSKMRRIRIVVARREWISVLSDPTTLCVEYTLELEEAVMQG